jgi:hypothetical protein
MKKLPWLLLILLIAGVSVFAFAKKSGKKKCCEKKCIKKSTTLATMTKNGITLTELYSPESFENASLKLTGQPTSEELDSNKMHLKFELNNYELGKQSDMTGLKSCANSAQGQHIHFIVDNEPYLAEYKSEFTESVKPGFHTVLCFLSRSYHESVKNKNAYVIENIITGTERYTARYANRDLTKPLLFYSRPKGEYVGADAQSVMLDFYLVNCDLSETGYKVKAEINGTEFMITKWAPYFMEGLPMGDNTIKLTLLDANGQIVDSYFNTAERKIKLKAS